MKNFRERLRQPEAYIRETLETIADLSKSGTYAMTWSLKPENLTASEQAYGLLAPELSGGLDGADDSDMGDIDGEDEDDDNVKMEDVL